MQATVVELGDGNEGTFGPTPELEQNFQTFVSDVAKKAYARTPTNRIVCIDGRKDSAGVPKDDGEHADIQLPGSLPITDTAADLMDRTVTTPKLSELAAKNTHAAITAGYEVVVHGDDHAGKAGCAANAKLRDTLRLNYQTKDAIVPILMAVAKLTGLHMYVTEADMRESIDTGKERAEDETVWDVTPTELTDSMIANGAGYQALSGTHQERAVGVQIDESTYASQTFANDHTHQNGARDELFMVSAGMYVTLTRKEVLSSGGSERDAALKAMRGLLFSVGLAKKIGNQNLRIVVLPERVDSPQS